MKGPDDKRKLKVYVDVVKLRHTSHWDLDFLSREELDALMREDESESADGEAPNGDDAPAR